MLSKSWCSYFLPAMTALASTALFVLPGLAQGIPQVPTDVTGPGGSLGHAQDIRKLLLGPDRNTVPDSHGIIVARDGRYCFTGRWMPLAYGTQVATVPVENSLAAVIPASVPPVLPPSVFIRTRDVDATRTPPMAEVMQSFNADYAMSAAGQVVLNSGALLIKTTNGCPIDVTSSVGSQLVTVKMSRGAYALVSMLGGRLTVADLSDNAQGGCSIFLGNGTGCPAETLLRVGHLAEIYPTCSGCAENELVAYTVLSKTPLAGGVTLETMRFSYPRALKRFNMTANIGDGDLRRLLKTAAAVSYVDREREWLGEEQYAP